MIIIILQEILGKLFTPLRTRLLTKEQQLQKLFFSWFCPNNLPAKMNIQHIRVKTKYEIPNCIDGISGLTPVNGHLFRVKFGSQIKVSNMFGRIYSCLTAFIIHNLQLCFKISSVRLTTEPHEMTNREIGIAP